MKKIGKIKLSNLSKREINTSEMDKIKGGCTWWNCYCGSNWNYESSMPSAVLNNNAMAGY